LLCAQAERTSSRSERRAGAAGGLASTWTARDHSSTVVEGSAGFGGRLTHAAQISPSTSVMGMGSRKATGDT